MTYAEIINALENMLKNFDGKVVDFMAISSALDLINRQQAEIERLTKETMNMAITIETCQAEAIKEFAERLKGNFAGGWLEMDEDWFEKFVKEMMGEE